MAVLGILVLLVGVAQLCALAMTRRPRRTLHEPRAVKLLEAPKERDGRVRRDVGGAA